MLILIKCQICIHYNHRKCNKNNDVSMFHITSEREIFWFIFISKDTDKFFIINSADVMFL